MSNSDAHDAYVLRRFESLMRDRLGNSKGETRHKAELNLAVLLNFHMEASMNQVGVTPEMTHEEARDAQEQIDAWIKGEAW